MVVDKKHTSKQSAVMHLITMAYLGEAQGVIEKFKLTKIKPDLFKNEEMVLLITGEGPFEAATKTALEIPQHKITSIINLGIAGSLSEELRPFDFVPVRTIYLVQDLKPQFKTFQSEDKGVDCLTSFERILDPEKARVLKGIAHIVDREAWGVAMAAKSAGIPMKSYKVISDMAGTSGACELVKETAEELSEKLANELATLLNIKVAPEEAIDLPGFHLTFSTRHRLKTLLQKLSIKEEKSIDNVLSSLPLDELRALEVSPKERARRLMELLEDRVDPFKKTLLKKLEGMQTSFHKAGLRLNLDPNFENPKATISLEVAHDEELNEKINLLKTLSIEPFTKIMKGEFDVE